MLITILCIESLKFYLYHYIRLVFNADILFIYHSFSIAIVVSI
jgi:hypothetical protein